MGIAVADYDGDGLTDVFVTHLGNETHTLWRQGPAGFFRDRTQDSRVVRTAWRGTGFGAVAADFDRDGWPDIAYVNGRVHRAAVLPEAGHLPAFWQPYAERNQLLRNTGKGQFEDVSEAQPGLLRASRTWAAGWPWGTSITTAGRTCWSSAVGGRARLYRNVAPGGHWLGVRVTDPARGNRDLLGTVVRVTAGGRTWMQVAQSAHSYLSASDPRPLFGLGGATAYDRIEVTWPDGTRETFPGGPADRWVSLTPGSGNPLEPRRPSWPPIVLAAAAASATTCAAARGPAELPPPPLPDGVDRPAGRRRSSRASGGRCRRPQSGTAWGELGMAFDAHEAAAEAVACYRRAMDLDPGRRPLAVPARRRVNRGETGDLDKEEAVRLVPAGG